MFLSNQIYFTIYKFLSFLCMLDNLIGFCFLNNTTGLTEGIISPVLYIVCILLSKF